MGSGRGGGPQPDGRAPPPLSGPAPAGAGPPPSHGAGRGFAVEQGSLKALAGMKSAMSGQTTSCGRQPPRGAPGGEGPCGGRRRGPPAERSTRGRPAVRVADGWRSARGAGGGDVRPRRRTRRHRLPGSYPAGAVGAAQRAGSATTPSGSSRSETGLSEWCRAYHTTEPALLTTSGALPPGSLGGRSRRGVRMDLWFFRTVLLGGRGDSSDQGGRRCCGHVRSSRVLAARLYERRP